MKRYCPQCKVRFVNTNTCDPQRFERRMKRNEEKAAIRLKKVEDEMYGYERPIYKKPQEFKLADLPASGDQAILGGGGKNKGRGKGAKGDDSEEEGGVDTDPAGRALRRKENNPPKQVMKKAGEVEVALPMKKRTNGANAEAKETVLPGQREEDLSAELLHQLASLNKGKAALMNEVVAQAEERVKSADEFQASTTAPRKVGGKLKMGGSASGSGSRPPSQPSSLAGSKGPSAAGPKGGSKKSSKRTSGGGGGGAAAAASKGPSADPAMRADAKGDKFDLLLA